MTPLELNALELRLLARENAEARQLLDEVRADKVKLQRVAELLARVSRAASLEACRDDIVTHENALRDYLKGW